MERVRLVSNYDLCGIIGDAGSGISGFQFGADEPADWLVVLDDLQRGLKTNVPRERRIAIITEPPGFKTYWPKYLDQFGIVLSPFETTKASGTCILSQPCLGWFYGIDFSKADLRPALDRQALLDLKPPPKSAKLSAVLSTKTRLPMHRRRLEFAARLKERLKDRFDLYGRGFHEIDDKRQAIDPYRYHLALENAVEWHYWTEKLADPLLGWALPLYSGAPAADQYFPEGAFVRLDLRGDLEQAIAQVERLLDEDPYEKHLPAIAEARRRIIEEYTLPAVIARVVRNQGPVTSAALAVEQELVPSTLCRPLYAHLTEIPRRWVRSVEKMVYAVKGDRSN